MARLYIANCSNQRQIIMYRLDYEPDGTATQLRRFQQAKASPPIMPGQQIVLHGDLDIETQIPHVITQLEVFGLRAEKDIGRLAGKTPYLYNINQAVKEHSIRAAMAHNAGVLARDGLDRRKAAAIAANTVLEDTALKALEPRPQGFETSVEQQDLVTDESRLEEGYRIGVPKGSDPEPLHTRRGKRKAA